MLIPSKIPTKLGPKAHFPGVSGFQASSSTNCPWRGSDVGTEGSNSLRIPAKPFPVTAPSTQAEAEGQTLLLLLSPQAPVTLSPHRSCSIFPFPGSLRTGPSQPLLNAQRDFPTPQSPQLPFVRHLPYLIYLEILYIKVFSCQRFRPPVLTSGKRDWTQLWVECTGIKLLLQPQRTRNKPENCTRETSGKAGISTFQSC